VLAFAGIGIEYLANNPEMNTESGSSAAGSAEKAAPMIASDSAQLVTAPGDQQILASGVDYQPGTLADSAARSAADAPAGSTEAGKNASFGADAAVTGLQRLRGRDALLACLDAIARAKNAGPITVSTVDYARFQGRPALVVRFSAAGARWVWATGPECGAPAAGASRLVEVRVG
jgi:hypothetical protein